MKKTTTSKVKAILFFLVALSITLCGVKAFGGDVEGGLSIEINVVEENNSITNNSQNNNNELQNIDISNLESPSDDNEKKSTKSKDSNQVQYVNVESFKNSNLKSSVDSVEEQNKIILDSIKKAPVEDNKNILLMMALNSLLMVMFLFLLISGEFTKLE